MMNITQKREICYKLRMYVTSFSSQKRAAASLQNVSEATLIAMQSFNEDTWSKISDDMWRNISAQVGAEVDLSPLAETQNFQTLCLYIGLAKDHGETFALVGNAGWGKSYAAKWYSAVNRKKNVYYVECQEWGKRQFLQTLAVQMGVSTNAGIPELMAMVCGELRKQEKPVIILDEFDKLQDAVFRTLITFYNQLNGHCGLVCLSTGAIRKRFVRGLHREYMGYQEIYSRLGASFVQLTQPTTDEVTEICSNNGMTDKKSIATICNEVKDLKGDLRRCIRGVFKDKIRQSGGLKTTLL